jgi:hypothetical protein
MLSQVWGTWFGAAANTAGSASKWSALQRRVAIVALVCGGLWSGNAVVAFTAPAAGTFGYDIYDVVVTQILSGPIGFVGGVVLIVWGASQLMRSWMTTIMCVIAGTVLIKAVTILTSLGMLV